MRLQKKREENWFNIAKGDFKNERKKKPPKLHVADDGEFALQVALQRLEDVHEELAEDIQHLVVVLEDGHLEVEAGEPF